LCGAPSWELRRARYIRHASIPCTVTALLVCAVIATLFVGAFGRFDTSVPVALLFVAAMVAFIGGLLFFLRKPVPRIRGSDPSATTRSTGDSA
jgi:hypothetical protein